MRQPGSERILIVDDQPANLQMLGSTLGKLGYEIVPATDGSSALRRLVLRPPDLVLLDLVMPGMDGCEVCRRIRAQEAFREVPVIFLSAADEKEMIVRALESGGVDYLTKPFNQSELILRVRTHLALKAARDRLTRLAEDKEELLGILAHDLKNHIGGMQMTAQLLRDRLPADAPRLRTLAENLVGASGRTLGFLQEFLANAAHDHRLPAVHLGPVDLNAAVGRSLEAYAEAARIKGQRLETSLAPDGVWVRADLHGLRRVIDNLVSNAVKFSPSGRRIEVSTRLEESTGSLSVRDEGPGLSAGDRERLFRRYTRLSARPTGGEPSTGLGLSIVKTLVEAMGGTVQCEDGAGPGACFRVSLPRARETAQAG